jgi:enoyl-CoA hydratase/carnithine racemase
VSERLLVEDRGPVRILTLNRPEKRNAFDVALARALWDGLERAGSDASVRAVVVTGQGPYFSAGVDVNVFVGMSGAPGDDVAMLARLHEPIVSCAKPTIAAIQGPAVGMGVTLLPHFDLVYAAEDATFMVPFMRLGLGVEFAGSFHLTRAMGLSRAKELVLRGKPIDAATAAQWNLVTRVVPGPLVLAQAVEAATDIAAHPAGAVRDARAVLNAGLQTASWAQAMEEENRVLSTRYGSPENVEAVMAWMARKR